MRMRALGVAFACVALAIAAWGQVITGTISGTVRDNTGAILPGVSIQVQNADTGVGRSLITDERGYYTASNLSPGNYQVSASLEGFQQRSGAALPSTLGQRP
jgi:protocatechuate 3,4-dioxygenase beta subunit